MKKVIKNLKEKYQKTASPIRRIFYIMGSLIFLPVAFVLFVILLYNSTHLYHKTDSYFTKKSYRRDILVNFIYKGEEYKINSTVNCLNKGEVFSNADYEWYTNWQEKFENNEVELKDGVVAKFFVVAYDKFFTGSFFKHKIKGWSSPVCDALLMASDEEINLFMKQVKENLIKNLRSKQMTESQIEQMFLSDREYANVDFRSVINLVSNQKDKNGLPKNLDAKITSVSFGERRPTTN